MCRVFKGIGAGSARLLSHSKETERAGREKDGNAPRPTTEITKNKVVRDKERK
jgi:hypothetical protein